MMRRRTFCPTPEEWLELRSAARSRDLSLRSRARALCAHGSGETYRQVCSEFGIAKQTLGNWIQRFGEQGIAGLRDRKWARRKPVLRQQVAAHLPDLLHQTPRQFGIERSHWTVGSVQQGLAEEWGVEASLETIRLALHSLGQCWKRAKRTITSPDPDYEVKKGQWISS